MARIIAYVVGITACLVGLGLVITGRMDAWSLAIDAVIIGAAATIEVTSRKRA